MQDNVNPHNLRMHKGTFSLDTTRIVFGSSPTALDPEEYKCIPD